MSDASSAIGLQPIKITPFRGIIPSATANPSGFVIPPPLIAQATIEENHTDTLEVTRHPLEQGATMSDHAYRLPAEVTLHLAWSNSPTPTPNASTPSLAAISGNTPNQVVSIYEYLLNLLQTRILFSLFTGKRSYANMLLKSLGTITDQRTENALLVVAHCTEIIIVQTQVVTLTASIDDMTFGETTYPVTEFGQVALTPGTHYTPLPSP